MTESALERARRELLDYIVIEISGNGRSRPHSDGVDRIARLEAAAREEGWNQACEVRKEANAVEVAETAAAARLAGRLEQGEKIGKMLRRVGVEFRCEIACGTAEEFLRIVDEECDRLRRVVKKG